jgi:hypothetical protein
LVGGLPSIGYKPKSLPITRPRKIKENLDKKFKVKLDELLNVQRTIETEKSKKKFATLKHCNTDDFSILEAKLQVKTEEDNTAEEKKILVLT